MHSNTPLLGRRALVLGAAALAASGSARAESTEIRIGVFSLLGNSVRVVAKTLDEVMFKDVAMDDVVLAAAAAAVQARWPQVRPNLQRAAEQVNVDDQLAIGNEAARRGKLPEWIVKAASAQSASHVLLITSSSGAMEFRTGLSQVVGNYNVTGVGFYVGADGRTSNDSTGAVASGYLAPFAQLRVTLVDVAQGSVVGSVKATDGYIVGPPESEAPDPWRFLSREEKARALRQLLKSNVTRAVDEVLKGI